MLYPHDDHRTKFSHAFSGLALLLVIGFVIGFPWIALGVAIGLVLDSLT